MTETACSSLFFSMDPTIVHSCSSAENSSTSLLLWPPALCNVLQYLSNEMSDVTHSLQTINVCTCDNNFIIDCGASQSHLRIGEISGGCPGGVGGEEKFCAGQSAMIGINATGNQVHLQKFYNNHCYH